MKKVIFISALAIAAAVSCTKSDIVDTAVDNAIKFENYVGRDAQTKAAIVKGVSYVNVNAWLHTAGVQATTENFEANFMTNQVVNADGSYTPAKYWPNELQAVSFVGWVPVENAKVTNATLTFSVPANDVTKQTDLLVAGSQLNKNNDGPVQLNFKHLLSRIGFQINVSGLPAEGDANNTIELKEVVLNGAFASEGTVDMTAEAPAVVGTPATTAYTLTGVNFKDENNTVLTSNVLTNGNFVNEDNSYIMLIPAGNVPANITVVYTVTTAAQVEGGAPTVITNTAVFPLQPTTEGAKPFAYEAGKAYKYIFDITMDAITFSVKEIDWDETAATPGTTITPEDDTTGDDTTGDDTTGDDTTEE